jgi:hypothetical protein
MTQPVMILVESWIWQPEEEISESFRRAFRMPFTNLALEITTPVESKIKTSTAHMSN